MRDRPIIPLYRVNMPPNVGEFLLPVLRSGMITEGVESKAFEEAFQEYVGNPNTAMVNSGTSGITLAGRLAGIGPGTSVIASPQTCLAGTEWILLAGARVIWCDVDPHTGNIDPEKIEALIAPDTRAITFVDWAGTPAELDRINEIAAKYGLKVIEDAAHALGALYKGRKTGTSCDFTMFSLQAIKHLTVTDGGALACRTKEDYDRAVLLRWFGLRRGHNKSAVCWEGDVTEPGYKFHMNNVNASIGLAQLAIADNGKKHIDNVIDAHRRNGRFLMGALKNIPGIELCVIPDYIDPSFWIFTIKLRDVEHRRTVSEKLSDRGVMSSITHTRNDAYSLFGNSNGVHLPGLDDFGSRMLNIPCGWWCTPDDMQHIVNSLQEAV